MGVFLSRLLVGLAPHTQLSNTFFPPPSTYEPGRDMPDLTGKVAIVTGGNSGIGYETTKQHLLKGARVYLAARSESKAQAAIARLEVETGKRAIWLELDLSDLTSVKRAAKTFLEAEAQLDILFNNAGVMLPPVGQLTKQGYDLSFGSMVLGHYLFTLLLLPALRRATRARIVHTSSGANVMAPSPRGIKWTTLKGGAQRDSQIRWWTKWWAAWLLYGQAKLGNVLISNIFHRQLSAEGIVSVALHPGGVRSELHGGWRIWQLVANAFFWPVHMGAYTLLYAGTSPDGEKLGGQFLYPWARIGRADPRAANEKTQDELKKWLDGEVKEYVE